MFLDKLDMLILEELSRNSRQHLKDIAAKGGCSINTVSARLGRLERELKLRYTLELDFSKDGFPREFVVRAKFEGKPQLSGLRESFARLPGVQLAALTEGDFDLLLWCLAPSSEEYGFGLGQELRGVLGKSLADWSTYPVIDRHIGFLPVDSDLIDMLRLSEHRRRVLKILNEGSRMMVTELAEQLGVTEPTAEYHLKRIAPVVKRFTSYFESPGEFVHISRFVQLRGGAEELRSEGRGLTELYVRSDTRLFNRLVYAARIVGGWDVFMLETFTSLEDYKEHNERVASFRKIVGKQESALITKVLKGRIPIRKVDFAKEVASLFNSYKPALEEKVARL